MFNMANGDVTEKHTPSQQAGDQDSSAKTLLLFVAGILLVGFVVFIVRDSSRQNKSQENLLASPLEEVQKPDEIKEEPLTDASPEPLLEPLSEPESEATPNLERQEVQGMSDQNSKVKMTVEQKLAVQKPTEMIDSTKNYTATFKTNMGDIVIALDARNRPQTVNNFVYLANLGFYDDVIFHRVIANFMIQGGDPLGMGTGGPAYKFADELSAPNSNAKGTISMANSGPNTNGSQFFINLVDNNYLDAKHTVFGKVTSGMDVVEAIGKVQTGQNDKPLTPVKIESIEITQE